MRVGIFLTARSTWPGALTIMRIHHHVALALALSAVSAASQPGDSVARSVAGSGVAGYAGDGGDAARAQLREPFHVAFCPAHGEMYIADTMNHCVRRAEPDGSRITTVAGCGRKGYTGDGGPAAAATLNEPYGVAVDGAHNLYIVDRLNACIRRVDGRTGVIRTLAGNGKAGFSGDGGPADRAKLIEPNGLALDGYRLYIADVADNRIRLVNLRTNRITTFAGTGKRAFSGDGGPAARASINGARAVCISPWDSAVYICEREGNRIRRVDPKTGVITTIAGAGEAGYSGDGGPALAATFRGPKWIAAGERDDPALYVVDTENHAVRRIDLLTGRIRTVMGSGRRGAAGDGAAPTSAEMDRPHGCALRAGMLYVADTNNHRIRACPAAPLRTVRVPTLDRLRPESLREATEDAAGLAISRRAIPAEGGLLDLRCVLHAHSYLSHDSRGTIAEIAAAAHDLGIDAVLLSNHPKKDQDVVAAGQTGEVNGVLFFAGAETNGFLAYPGDGRLPELAAAEQPFVDSVNCTRGMVFVAHPEEHADWSLRGLTGTEIYNTHADFKDEKALLAALQPRDSAGYARLFGVLDAFQKYPRAAFAALADYPADNLRRYESLAARGPAAAIAGNDSHQNTGFVLRGLAGGKIAIEDPLGDRMGTLDAAKNPLVKALFGDPEPGKVLTRRLLDPYPVSLGYVSTHVLAATRTHNAIAEGLRSGRTYVSFDWMAPASGTQFTVRDRRRTYRLGDTIPAGGRPLLSFEAPQASEIRFYRGAELVHSAFGYSASARAPGPGVYHAEAWLRIGGELRPWILTGAIRVMDATRHLPAD